MTIKRPGIPLSQDDIQQFESRHKLQLPDDYRAYMLQHNGGMPWMVYFQSASGDEYALTQLHSIGCDHPYDLDNQCRCHDWPAAYKEGTIVIGRDCAGSEFLMATRGKEAGSIYFLNREPTLRPKGRVARIASSFSEMMDNLKPSFPDEEE